MDSGEYPEAVGKVASEISWAIAALEAGDAKDARSFLIKAQLALLPVFPTMPMGACSLYIARPDA